MKKLLCVILATTLVAGLVGCSSKNEVGEQGQTSNNEVENNAEEIISDELDSDITAKIVKSGAVDNAIYTQDLYTIELVSWDLGYSGHVLTKGNEVLCIKFHVKNESEEQHKINDIFFPKIFLDGVEISPFGSDFYGDGRSFNVFLDSDLRAGAETDIYLCLDCSISESHKIEVDLMELGEELGYTVVTDNVLTTLSFDVE